MTYKYRNACDIITKQLMIKYTFFPIRLCFTARVAKKLNILKVKIVADNVTEKLVSCGRTHEDTERVFTKERAQYPTATAMKKIARVETVLSQSSLSSVFDKRSKKPLIL
jgi:hypothetical protein